MTDLAYLSATELAALIRSRDLSSVELTQRYIDRIEQYDGDVNAVVVRIFDQALIDAGKADDAIQNRHQRDSVDLGAGGLS
jgi:amidase